jgi:hypothetical protein
MEKQVLTRKAAEPTKQKAEKRKKPKPKEQEGTPQRQHCPPEERRGDRNPECHEEHPATSIFENPGVCVFWSVHLSLGFGTTNAIFLVWKKKWTW